MKTLIVALVAVGLAGCQTVALQTPASISFNNSLDDNASAQEAQAHCRKYGKNAEYIPHEMAYYDGMAHFRCVR